MYYTTSVGIFTTVPFDPSSCCAKMGPFQPNSNVIVPN